MCRFHCKRLLSQRPTSIFDRDIFRRVILQVLGLSNQFSQKRDKRRFVQRQVTKATHAWKQVFRYL